MFEFFSLNNQHTDRFQTDQTPAKHIGKKRSALEMTPSLSASASKRHAGSRSRSGRSGTDAMFSVAGAIEALADSFTDGPASLTSPQRRSSAIAQLDEDADLSENEQVQAIRLFSRHTSIADSYLAIKKKSVRTLYIQSELSQA